MKLHETEPYKSLFPSIEIKDWSHMIEFYTHKIKDWDQWVFRGQKDSEWPLTTAIERHAVERWELTYDELPAFEFGLIRVFKRHFHNYSQYRPKDEDNIEWLSIMQHHGTVTRLLDCTYSFYAALFFALQETRPNPDKMSAVWAFDSKWLYDKFFDKLPDNEKKEHNFTEFNKVVTDSDRDNFFLFKRKLAMPSIYPVNAFCLNKRLIIQQGVFLVPGDIKKSFIENLQIITDNDKNQKEHLYLILLHNRNDFLKDAIRELNRMNMNSAILFPGLDGFARHLNKGVIMPELVKVDNKEPNNQME